MNYELFTMNQAQAWAVEVEPARLELSIPPDQPTQGSLTITNPGQKAVKVRLQSGPYRFLQKEVRIPSAENWFSFEPSEFTLASFASTTVTYTVTPPSSVLHDTAGEYLAALEIDQLPLEEASSTQERGDRSSEEKGGRITVVPRLGIPAYLKIQGRELIEVEVVSLRLQAGSSQGTLRVLAELHNRGTVHIRPSGTLTIFSAQGQIVHSGPLGRALPLLPTARMEIPTTVPSLGPGRYHTLLTIETVPGNFIQRETSFEITPDGQIGQST